MISRKICMYTNLSGYIIPGEIYSVHNFFLVQLALKKVIVVMFTKVIVNIKIKKKMFNSYSGGVE